MLHRVKELVHDEIAAVDGIVGRVDDIYFDDARWAVRYLVVDTGGSMAKRKVLIAPAAIDRARSSERTISVGLTRDQIAASPSVDSEKPISRQLEEAHARYYGYPFYWAPEGVAMPAPDPAAVRQVREAERQAGESHLRSSDEVIGYSIDAADGRAGHVEDLLIDDDSWSVADLVVDTRNWLPGDEVLVPPSAVESIDWGAREVHVRLRREDIERQPRAR